MKIEKLSKPEKEQIVKQARFTAGIIRTQGVDAIPVSVLKKDETGFITGGMIEKFWDAVDNTRVPQSIFLMGARVALRHGLLVDERGSSCCGGAADYRALVIPDDFEERIQKFLNPEEKNGKTSTGTKQAPNVGRQQLAFAGL